MEVLCKKIMNLYQRKILFCLFIFISYTMLNWNKVEHVVCPKLQKDVVSSQTFYQDFLSLENKCLNTKCSSNNDVSLGF